MSIDPQDEKALEALFTTARETSPPLDEGLARRMMPPEEAATADRKGVRSGFQLGGLLSALGGLGMATAIGVWIGVAVPVETLLGLDFVGIGATEDFDTFYAGSDPFDWLIEETGL